MAKTKLAMALGVILGVTPGFTQEASYQSNPFLAGRLHFAHRDAQVAIQLGSMGSHWPVEGWNYGIFGEIEMRPFGKDHLVPISEHLRYQYQEVRAQIGAGGFVAYQFVPKNEIRFGVGLGGNFGIYRGVSALPPMRISPSLEVSYGLRCMPDGVFSFGYQYRDWPHTSPHRFGVTWTAVIRGIQ